MIAPLFHLMAGTRGNRRAAKTAYFIDHNEKERPFFAIIGSTAYGKDPRLEVLVIVTSASNKGMADIHD